MPRILILRNLLLHAVGAVLLTYYGIAVCPFLEQLYIFELFGVLAVGLGVAFAAKTLILARLDSRAAVPDLGRPWRHLKTEWLAWMLAGCAIAAWNHVVFGYPTVESGLKVVLGCATCGALSATIQALDVERATVECLVSEARLQDLRSDGFVSIATKFFVFVAASLASFAAIVVLIIYKDFQWVKVSVEQMRQFDLITIAHEVAYVFLVWLGGCIIAAKKYSRNLRLMFGLQLRALEAVEREDFDSFVPVVSHDEFSRIADQTNRMIAGLRDRARIRRAFGKYMSPQVAESILDTESEANLGGREAHVVVLFTDLRGFTPYSERCAPQELIRILNRYFTMVVSAVHGCDGVLDKFIGDAAMAVFGLEGRPDAADRALKAALEIRSGLKVLNEDLVGEGLTPLRNGVGIHCGLVVAGNIGSEERLEYTVIGDTVNVASRLEGLTKTLPMPVALSERVYAELDESNRTRVSHLGAYEVKGKTEKIEVYGLDG